MTPHLHIINDRVVHDSDPDLRGFYGAVCHLVTVYNRLPSGAARACATASIKGLIHWLEAMWGLIP